MESKIIGYEKEIDFFERIIKDRKIPAAILLTGQPHIGKKSIIEHLGKGILCDENNWCGVCPSCKVSFAVHPDVIRKNVDSDSVLKEEMSNLLKKIHQKPLLSKRMVVIIENVDSYSDAAASLLLKAIEDSPAYVNFLMTAVYPESVVATVRSRSLIKKLSPLTVDSLAEKIADREAAYLSGGRVELALKIIAEPETKAKYENWLNIFKKLNKMSIVECSSLADEIDKSKETEEILRFFQAFLREQVKLIIENGWLGRRDIQTAIRRTRESKAMLKANVPPRLVLEYVLFNQIKA